MFNKENSYVETEGASYLDVFVVAQDQQTSHTLTRSASPLQVPPVHRSLAQPLHRVVGNIRQRAPDRAIGKHP
jgi:hypothetical protein